MRILVAGTIQGDNGYEEEFMVKSIERYLKDSNHIVDSFMLPYTRDMLTLPDQIAAYQMLDVSDADLLITIGYPACMLSHNNKISYLLETAPMLNEYWNSEYGVLDSPQYSRISAAIHTLEEKSFKAAKLVCNSQRLSKDIADKYMIETKTLYTPNIYEVDNDEPVLDEPYYVSETSLLPYHRIELLLDIMEVVSDDKLCLYIPRCSTIYYRTLNEQIEKRRLSDKVYVRKGMLPDHILRGAKAYLSTDFQVRKLSGGIIRSAGFGINIIACEDSGAIGEYIQVHKCGIIEKPDPKLISRRLKGMPLKRKSNSETTSFDVNIFMEELTSV